MDDIDRVLSSLTDDERVRLASELVRLEREGSLRDELLLSLLRAYRSFAGRYPDAALFLAAAWTVATDPTSGTLFAASCVQVFSEEREFSAAERAVLATIVRLIDELDEGG
jgi:hypothetical protein